MINRFEQFSTAIAYIYKYLQKVEKLGMEKYNLKGSHTQCVIAMHQHPEGITASQLCSIYDKDKAAVSRTISELEKRGLVERDLDNGNTYRAKIHLTPQGKIAAEQVTETAKRAVEKAGAGLSNEHRKIFYASLDLIASNLKKIYSEGEI